MTWWPWLPWLLVGWTLVFGWMAVRWYCTWSALLREEEARVRELCRVQKVMTERFAECPRCSTGQVCTSDHR